MEKITPELEQFFIEKTVRHIRLVQDNMIKIAMHGGFLGVPSSSIVRRAFLHDNSKFDADTYEGYIFYHFRISAIEKKLPIPEYSKELDDFIFSSVKKHRSQSRHHPEYYNDVNNMHALDLIEMVCDWVSIAQENKTTLYKSSRDFANAVIGKTYMFDEEHKNQIYAIIDLLAELNGKEY